MFNSVVATDFMHLQGKTVLHITDEATHFASSLFLKKSSSSNVSKTFLRCGVHVFLGLPDYSRVDQGSYFRYGETGANEEDLSIELVKEPIECPHYMSHVARYNGSLRVTYETLKRDLPKTQIRHLINSFTLRKQHNGNKGTMSIVVCVRSTAKICSLHTRTNTFWASKSNGRGSGFNIQ